MVGFVFQYDNKLSINVAELYFDPKMDLETIKIVLGLLSIPDAFINRLGEEKYLHFASNSPPPFWTYEWQVFDLRSGSLLTMLNSQLIARILLSWTRSRSLLNFLIIKKEHTGNGKVMQNLQCQYTTYRNLGLQNVIYQHVHGQIYLLLTIC